MNEGIKVARENDIEEYKKDLEEENAAYEAFVNKYNAWIAENVREEKVLHEALSVISTVDLAPYIQERVNAKDGLVKGALDDATPHV